MQKLLSLILMTLFAPAICVSPDKTNKAEIAIRIPDKSLRLAAIVPMDDYLWLLEKRDVEGQIATDVYRLKGFDTTTVRSSGLRVNNVTKVAKDTVWFATDHGVYQVVEDRETLELRPLTAQGLNVLNVIVVGTTRLIVGDDRLSIDRGTLRQPELRTMSTAGLDLTGDQKWVESFGQVWFTAFSGAALQDNEQDEACLRVGTFRLENDRAVPLEGLSGTCNLQSLANHVWVSNHIGLYRIDNNAPVLVTDNIPDVLGIESAGEREWVRTTHGLYRVDGELTAQRLNLTFINETRELNISSVRKIGSEIWFLGRKLSQNTAGTTTWLTEAYRIKQDTAKPIFPPDVSFNQMESDAGKVWLLTYDSVYEVKDTLAENPQRIRFLDKLSTPVFIRSEGELFKDREGHAWIKTYDGAFRVDDNTIISVVPQYTGNWRSLVKDFLPSRIWLSGEVVPVLDYSRCDDGSKAYPESFPSKFDVIFQIDKEAGTADENISPFYPAQNFPPQILTSGRHTINIKARDKWGNTFTYASQNILVLPEFIGLAVLGILLWVVLIGAVILLAPFFDFFQRLLMNPWIRGIGTFWLLPVIITTVPLVRSYVLQRYLRSLRMETNCTELQDAFHPSSGLEPEKLGARLEASRTLLFVSEDSTETALLLKYLVCYYARANRTPNPKGVVPVHIPLIGYNGVSPEKMFYAQLDIHGGMTDESLNSWFLQQGGFLFLFDGLDQVDESTRQTVINFVNSRRRGNYFCISASQTYRGFDKLEEILM